MTWFGKVVTQNSVWAMEKVGLVPKGTHDVGEALKTAGASPLPPCPAELLANDGAADALVAGGREKLFTPMMVRPSHSRLSTFAKVVCHSSSSAASPRTPSN